MTANALVLQAGWQTDHKQRETERQRDRETERQRDRETERQIDRETDIHIFMHTYRQTD
jgi:hypothetical protein